MLLVLVVLVVVILRDIECGSSVGQSYLDFSSFRDILVFVDEPQFVEQRTPLWETGEGKQMLEHS